MKTLIKIFLLLFPFLGFAQLGTGLYGKVGINVGTTAPTERLKVNGTSNFTGLGTFSGGITATGIVSLPSTTSIGSVSATEVGYIDGLTSNAQTQINNKKQIVSSISDLVAFSGNYADFDGSEWVLKNGNESSNGGDFPGTKIRKNSEYYWERQINNNQVNPEYFGAVSDWDDSTNIGTDCTDAIQKAIDYLKEIGGGEVVLLKPFVVNGTIYVNTTNEISISILGFSNQKLLENVNGSTIIRQTEGDIFRVNMNPDGSGYLPFPQLYTRFSIKGVQAIRKRMPDGSLNAGMTLINAFRTQSAKAQNFMTFGFDYMVYEANTDVNGVDNYCDQWNISDFAIYNSTKGGLRLFATDASIIDRFSFENPAQGASEAIKVIGSTTTRISNGIFWNPSDGDSTVSESVFITLAGCRAMEVKNMHIERIHFSKAFATYSSSEIVFSEIHSRYSSNDFFYFENSNNIQVNNWYSWENKNAGKKDIINSGSTNISLSNFSLVTFPDAVVRSIASTGTIITNGSNYVSVSSDQTITGKKVFSNNVGIGSISDTETSLYIDKNMTGTSVNGIWNRGIVQSGASTAYYFRTTGQSDSGSSLSTLGHYRASQGTISGSVTTQAGFIVESNLTSATTNLGFLGNIPSGTNRWNIYMDGTAPNFLRGGLYIGTSTAIQPSAALQVESTTQGFLPPRMTSTQRDAISGKATALVVWCTDCTATDGSTGVLQIWNGSVWKNAY